jgi:hypothetical protein
MILLLMEDFVVVVVVAWPPTLWNVVARLEKNDGNQPAERPESNVSHLNNRQCEARIGPLLFCDLLLDASSCSSHQVEKMESLNDDAQLLTEAIGGYTSGGQCLWLQLTD